MKASPAMSKTTRILTVDDSASMRALLNHARTSQGFDVAQAEDEDGRLGDKGVHWAPPLTSASQSGRVAFAPTSEP